MALIPYLSGAIITMVLYALLGVVDTKRSVKGETIATFAFIGIFWPISLIGLAAKYIAKAFEKD